jgi:Putative Actinobacterial Holin-X, holin superfamily III
VAFVLQPYRAMATVHRLDTTETPSDDSLFTRLTRLVALELELGWAETQGLIKRLAIAVALAVFSAIALLAAIVVLIAGALAPMFDAAWQHLVIAGGVVAVIALAGLAWSAWRLTHLDWPHQTLRSLEETWRWLVTLLKSKLTLR